MNVDLSLGGCLFYLAFVFYFYYHIDVHRMSHRLSLSIERMYQMFPLLNNNPKSDDGSILPTNRVSANMPFLQTGVDYAGPILYRIGKGRGTKTHGK